MAALVLARAYWLLTETSLAIVKFSLCKQHGVVSIFDETLTGLYRTGPLFMASELPQFPDILIFAKSIGNGVPASCVASNIAQVHHQRALKGSTFSDNPVACAAILATLEAITERIQPSEISRVEQTFVGFQKRFEQYGCELRGKGLLWVLACRSEAQANHFFDTLISYNYLVSKFGENIRFLPKMNTEASTIESVLSLLLTQAKVG